MFKIGAIRLCILSLLVLTAAACNSELPAEIEEPDPEFARVRIVNAAAGVGGVEVIRGGVTAPLATNLNYGAFTQSCVQLPADVASTLYFRQGTDTIATATFTPAADAKYTVFLTGSGATRRAVVLDDAHTPATGFNGVRFINASSGPGDVYVTAPDGEPTLATRVHGNIGVTAMGNAEPGFMGTEVERTRVRLYDVDVTTGTPRADIALTGLPASRLVSVVLADPAAAGPSASFLTYPC